MGTSDKPILLQSDVMWFGNFLVLLADIVRPSALYVPYASDCVGLIDGGWAAGLLGRGQSRMFGLGQ